jgi:hypothetical protein
MKPPYLSRCPGTNALKEIECFLDFTLACLRDWLGDSVSATSIYPLMHFSNESCDILENELRKAIFSLSGHRFRILFRLLYPGACA